MRDSSIQHQPWDVCARSANDDQHRDITVRAYRVNAETWNEGTRSVEAVIATEAPVSVFDMRTWEMIQEVLLMDGCRLPDNRQIPLIDTHNRSTIRNVYGSSRELRIESGQLVARNCFAADQDSKEAGDKVRDKHVTDNSIGYRVLKSVQVEPGATATVNGRTFTAPKDCALRVTTEWQPVENSLCVIGADPNAKTRTESDSQTETPQSASARAAAAAHTPAQGPQDGARGKETHMSFSAWLEARGLKEADLTETQRAALKADFDAFTAAQRTPPAPPPAPPANDTGRAEAVAQERRRIAEINEVARQHPEATPEMVSAAVTDGRSVDAFRAAVLEAIRMARPQTPAAPSVHDGQAPVERAHITAALCLRAGMSDTALVNAKHFTAPQMEQAYRMRSISLLQVAHEACRMAGRPLGRFVSDDELIQRASTTADFGNILADVANKAALTALAQRPSTAQSWCGERSVKDFKTLKLVRLTDVAAPEAINANGELKHGQIGDIGESLAVDTQGLVIGIGRKTLINDDMQMLTRVPQRMVMAQLLALDRGLYAAMIGNPTMEEDEKALFHADHANIQGSSGRKWFLAASPMMADHMIIGYLNGVKTPKVERIEENGAYLGVRIRMYFDFGYAAADWRGIVEGLGTLDATSLSAARTLLARQTDAKGGEMALAPKFLIVASEDEFTARQLVTSSTLQTVTGADATLTNTGTANPISAWNLEVIPTPFIAAS
jgi:hypothetical protein